MPKFYSLSRDIDDSWVDFGAPYLVSRIQVRVILSSRLSSFKGNFVHEFPFGELPQALKFMGFPSTNCGLSISTLSFPEVTKYLYRHHITDITYDIASKSSTFQHLCSLSGSGFGARQDCAGDRCSGFHWEPCGQAVARIGQWADGGPLKTSRERKFFVGFGILLFWKWWLKGVLACLIHLLGSLKPPPFRWCSWRHCRDLGMTVLALDDLSGGFPANVPEGVTFIEGATDLWMDGECRWWLPISRIGLLECLGMWGKETLFDGRPLSIWAWYRSNRAPKKWNAKNSSNDQTSVELKFVHTCLKLGNGFQR